MKTKSYRSVNHYRLPKRPFPRVLLDITSFTNRLLKHFNLPKMIYRFKLTYSQSLQKSGSYIITSFSDICCTFSSFRRMFVSTLYNESNNNLDILKLDLFFYDLITLENNSRNARLYSGNIHFVTRYPKKF